MSRQNANNGGLSSNKRKDFISCLRRMMPIALPVLAFAFPLVWYHGVIATSPSLARFPLWDWIFSSASPLACGLLALVAWWLCRKRTAPLLWGSARTLWILVGYAAVWSLLFNKNFMQSWPQIPYSVLFLLGTWLLSRACLGRLAYAAWVPCLTVLLLEYAASMEGFLVNPENLIQVFCASWHDAREYLSAGTVLLLVFALLLSFVAFWLVDRQMRKERRETLLFCGALCMGLLFLGVRPLERSLVRDGSLIWPLGNMEVLACYSAQAQRDIHQTNRLLEHLPPKGSVCASMETVPGGTGVVILIHVGESLCADHLSINGYGRNTTPWLAGQERLINFPDCVASADFTDKAVVTMLTNGRRDFMQTDDPGLFPSSAGMMDYFSACGFRCAYAFTDGIYNPRSHTMFHEEMHMMLRCADDSIASGARAGEQVPAVLQYITQHSGENLFILLNNDGSHAFFDEYDKEHPPFEPVRAISPNDMPPATPEVEACITNAYDCTVHYTDDNIRRLLEPLKGKPFLYVYMGDHGEYVGQGGYWMRAKTSHDTFYRTSVCQVPFMVMASPEFEALHPHFAEAMRQLRQNRNLSVAHEHLFHTVLGLMGIKTSCYDSALDLCSPEAKPYTGPHPSRNGEELPEKAL